MIKKQLQIDNIFHEEFKLLLDIHMIDYEIVECDNYMNWNLNLNNMQLDLINQFLYIHKIIETPIL